MEWVLPWYETLARLGVGFLAGALIGLDRERHQRPAGLRTHCLVSMASALFAMISVLAAGDKFDHGRIAAQVVTGIGFLGAGTIMRHGSTVRGLTTAASLWMAAALGLAAGFGWYIGASLGAVLTLLVLTVVKLLEDCVPRPNGGLVLLVHARPDQEALPEILQVLRSVGVQVHDVAFGEETLSEGPVYHVSVKLPAGLDHRPVVQALEALPNVDHAGPRYSRG